jgi:superoxide dismutase, Fe-Mn family
MYTEQKFELRGLPGLSEKQISEHLKLYAGYVKNANEKFSSFEWNGMRLHELYFETLSPKPGTLDWQSNVSKAIVSKFGSYDAWLADFKKIGLTRGIGWVLLVRDAKNDFLHNIWIASHDIGHLAGCDILLAMDMWEHAFLLDYLPSEKAKYIDAFFNNLDWSIIKKRWKK